MLTAFTVQLTNTTVHYFTQPVNAMIVVNSSMILQAFPDTRSNTFRVFKYLSTIRRLHDLAKKVS